MPDKPYRSLAKAISWRITASLDTLIISYIITGRLKWAAAISSVELCTKISLYYFHERIWTRLPIGKANRTQPRP